MAKVEIWNFYDNLNDEHQRVDTVIVVDGAVESVYPEVADGDLTKITPPPQVGQRFADVQARMAHLHEDHRNDPDKEWTGPQLTRADREDVEGLLIGDVLEMESDEEARCAFERIRAYVRSGAAGE